MTDAKTMSENLESRQSYELGFLLSPLVVADQVPQKVEELLKGPLLKIGAVIDNEEEIKLMSLAYPLKKVIDNKGIIFREAYFGVIYFQAPADQIATLESGEGVSQIGWQRLPELVRYLLLKKSPIEIKRYQAQRVTRAEPLADSNHGGVSPEADREAIDKEIEGLLAEPK